MMNCLRSHHKNDDARCAAAADDECACMCASPFPYRRLEDEQHNQAVKILFHKFEDSEEGKVHLHVERNLTVFEVCKLVATKMQYNTTAFWSMVEYWVDKKAERVLEEHEIMVDVFNEMAKFKRRANVRYVLRQTVSKFDFLSDPARIRNEGGVICENPHFFNNYHEICYIESVVDEGQCPVFFSRAGMRVEQRNVACFLLLRDQRLFYTADTIGTQKLLQLGEMFIRRHFYASGPIHVPDIPGIVLIGKLTELHVYRVGRSRPEDKDHILLRPAATPVLRNAEQTSVEPVEEDPYVGIPVLPKALIRLTSLSDNFATTWIALMRLAKYGKQLRENYRAFKNKNDTSTREFSRANVPNESVRSRVAMDFTGKQGRIVEDPVEANEIALAEGYMWKRRHKIPTRRTVNPKLNENHVDVGIHTMQPWFHSNLSRDQASSLVTRYGEGDGVFIVRPSRTSEGTYVLTYKCQGKLAHQQIVPMIDKERNITVFTLDNGQTKFYDILQLVEFYTVNLGPLMCRLTHYITENANIQTPNVPSPSNGPKYMNVAVNTDITIHSTEHQHLLESPSGSSKTTSSHSLSSR